MAPNPTTDFVDTVLLSMESLIWNIMGTLSVSLFTIIGTNVYEVGTEFDDCGTKSWYELQSRSDQIWKCEQMHPSAAFRATTTIVKLRTNFVPKITDRMTDEVPMIFHIKNPCGHGLGQAG